MKGFILSFRNSNLGGNTVRLVLIVSKPDDPRVLRALLTTKPSSKDIVFIVLSAPEEYVGNVYAKYPLVKQIVDSLNHLNVYVEVDILPKYTPFSKDGIELISDIFSKCEIVLIARKGVDSLAGIKVQHRIEEVIVVLVDSTLQEFAYIVLTGILIKKAFNSAFKLYFVSDNVVNDVLLDASSLDIDITRRELEVLCNVANGVSRESLVKKLVSDLNIPRSTAYRVLRNLIDKGLIVEIDNKVLRLSYPGLAFATVLCSSYTSRN